MAKESRMQRGGEAQVEAAGSGRARRYRFTDLVLDTGRRELRRDGEVIELGRLTYALLVALTEAAPNTLGHDELVERVWKGRMTSPETVTQRVKLLRDALGDDAERPRYVGLVRGQGYRLLPPLELVDVGDAALARPSRKARGSPAFAAVALLVVLAAGGFVVQGLRSTAPDFEQANAPSALFAPGEPMSVAVLPFDDVSAGDPGRFFAAGFHATLVSELTGISGLNVIARSSVERYAGTRVPLADIARELDVGVIVDGSVQQDGDRIRVTVSLVQPSRGRQLWARSYDRVLGDVFAVQTDIATSVAAALQTELLPAERRSIETPLTTSLAAYNLYLETLVDTDRRRLPLDDDRGRLPLLDRAIVLDPNFAQAYLARAEIFTWAVAYSEAGSSAEEVAKRADYERRALADAARALELAPTLPGPWLVRGILDLEAWRWTEAEAAFERALELGPNDPDAIMQYAFFKVYAGEYDQALELGRRRLALDPLSVESNNGLGFIAILAHDAETAVRCYEQVQRLAPGVWFYPTTLALAYLQKGDRRSAEAALRLADALRGPDDMGVFLTNSARVYRWLGFPDDARRAFDGFADWTRNNVVGEGDWALAYQGIGDYDRMYEALERAVAKVQAHESDSHQALISVVANMTSDPVLDEPRFVELRAQLLPEPARAAFLARSRRASP